MQIYLDYSATTPIRPEAIATLHQVLTTQWGNPSSLHAWGQRAALTVETARAQVGQLLGAEPEAIVFTGSGTEADNLAILGVARTYATPQHLIISSVEHSAVEKPAQVLERQGWAVTRLPVSRTGLVSATDLQAALRPNTVLISIIHGQSEVGTLQPIAALGAIARQAKIPFHTDAVQTAGRVPLDLRTLPVDLLSLSSHKLYGPQGVGALYIRPGLTLSPVLFGGAQEQCLRPGTQAVAAIAGFGTAAQLAAEELASESSRLQDLRDRLIDQFTAIPGVKLTGDRQYRLPHHTSFCLHEGGEMTGRSLVYQLNLAGIGVSSGSACNSGQSQPSAVLKAMGYGDRQALSALRLTVGKDTTPADVDWVTEVFRQILDRLGAIPQAPARLTPQLKTTDPSVQGMKLSR